MATILEKDITRESIIKYDNREIQVTLTADQKISMKLKGMKSGVLTISIEELYKKLLPVENSISDNKVSDTVVHDKVIKQEKNYNNSPMINLYNLRSLSAITTMELKTKTLFESIILELIRNEKNIKY